MFLSQCRDFPSAPCLASGGGEKKNLMTVHCSMLLKSRASLTCFRAGFLPSRAKDLSALRYKSQLGNKPLSGLLFKEPFDKNLGLAIACNKP